MKLTMIKYLYDKQKDKITVSFIVGSIRPVIKNKFTVLKSLPLKNYIKALCLSKPKAKKG